MEFLECVVYVAVSSFLSFIAGRVVPKNIFDADSFLFRSRSFENNGQYYEKFKIKLWKDKLLDMSKIFPKLMPSKDLKSRDKKEVYDLDKIDILIKETCVAELVHIILCFLGLGCIKIWRSRGGVVCFLLNLLGNLPYIMIQRYNRPRLMKILKKRRQFSTCTY